MRNTWSRLRSGKLAVGSFLAIFAALCLAGIFGLRNATGAMWTLKVLVATCVGGVMALLGYPTHTEGSHVTIGFNTLEIIDECTGIYAFVLLTAFIVAFPHRLPRKLRFWLMAIGFVFAANILRLVALAILIEHAGNFADFAHDYLWQVLWGATLVAFVVVYARGGRNPELSREPT
jgi:exosortase/archaeosortase family protein